MDDELKLFDLYEKSNKKGVKQFKEEVNSTVRVQTDFEKVVEDTEWIEIMELTIPYLDNILRNPNRFIINEEEIVKIEMARKITVESIKHLTKNTNFIQEIDKKTGDVRPSKILNINKEESYDTYENRFIFSLIQNMKFFISRKEKGIEERQKVSEKNNKQIDYNATSRVRNEKVDLSLKLTTKLDSDNRKPKDDENVLTRVEKIKQRLVDLSSNETYKLLEKKHMSLVTSPIKKTNVILKNTNFQYAVKLWNFLQENIDDKSKHISKKNDYEDDREFKGLVDEAFFLEYLIVNSLEKDEGEDEEKSKQMKQESLNHMIEKIIDINVNLSEEDLKELIANRFAVIKFRNLATMKEIQKIFKEHIEKYVAKVSK